MYVCLLQVISILAANQLHMSGVFLTGENMLRVPLYVMWQQVKSPLQRTLTFMPFLSAQRNDTHWSPRPRKPCFCVTAAAPSLCFSWITKTSVEAQQVTPHRQSEVRGTAMADHGLLWSTNGDTVAATVIAQWMLLVIERSHTGGTGEAEESPRLEDYVYYVIHFYDVTIGPLDILSVDTVMCVFSSCLIWATFEQLTSLTTFVWLFWTCPKLNGYHSIHGEVSTSCVPPLNDKGNCLASFEPPVMTWAVYGHTREAQGHKVTVLLQGVSR